MFCIPWFFYVFLVFIFASVLIYEIKLQISHLVSLSFWHSTVLTALNFGFVQCYIGCFWGARDTLKKIIDLANQYHLSMY